METLHLKESGSPKAIPPRLAPAGISELADDLRVLDALVKTHFKFIIMNNKSEEFMKCSSCFRFFPGHITMYKLLFFEDEKVRSAALKNKSHYPIPRYIFGCGSTVILENAFICYNCKDLLCANEITYEYDFDENERVYCANVRYNRMLDGTANRKYLHGIDLPNIVQNTSAWMKSRFGPDLKRVGASRAGAILCISQYGGAKSLYNMITGRNNINRWENSSRSEATEFGHFYEDYIRKLVMMLLPEFSIVEGGIRVPCKEEDRLKYAVSVDGDVYYTKLKTNGPLAGEYAGGFEAKCSYHVPHGDQARKEAIAGNKFYLNEDGIYGIKAEHMAQIQMQMGITGSKFTIYCTIKWKKYFPPNPKYGIPPFEDVVLLKIPFSHKYWHNYEKPALDKFADSLRGLCEPPTSDFPRGTIPRVQNIEDLLCNEPFPSEPRTRLNQLRLNMFHYTTENARNSKIREQEITTNRSRIRSMIDLNYHSLNPIDIKKHEDSLYDEWW